ncbi:MAG: aminotransferase class IV, partial [Bacteroidota bacterium]
MKLKIIRLMQIKYYNVNGVIVPIEEAVINVKDLGFLRGYSVFDFFRIYKRQRVFIEDHLARLEKSAGILGLAIPYTKEELVTKIVELAEANKMETGGIKIVLTGGYSSNGWLPSAPNFVMIASEIPVYPESMYAKGVKLMTYQYTRETPYTKTTNYLVPITIQKEIEAAEAFDVLYHDGEFISESARSNFFIVNHNGTIITPDKDALQGITRKHVLEVARQHFEVEIRPVTLKEAREAREAFMTSSTKGVLPVRQVDFWRINEGVIGATTKKLRILFQQHIEDYLKVAV